MPPTRGLGAPRDARRGRTAGRAFQEGGTVRAGGEGRGLTRQHQTGLGAPGVTQQDRPGGGAATTLAPTRPRAVSHGCHPTHRDRRQASERLVCPRPGLPARFWGSPARKHLGAPGLLSGGRPIKFGSLPRPPTPLANPLPTFKRTELLLKLFWNRQKRNKVLLFFPIVASFENAGSVNK